MASASQVHRPPIIVQLSLKDNRIDATTTYDEIPRVHDESIRRAMTELRTCPFAWEPSSVGHCGSNVPAPSDVRRSETLADGRTATVRFDRGTSETGIGFDALRDWLETHVVSMPHWLSHLEPRLADVEICKAMHLVEFGQGVKIPPKAPNYQHSMNILRDDDPRRWKALRYRAGGFFTAHTDSPSGPEHIATLILIPPKSYSDHEGGELVIHPTDSESASPTVVSAHSWLTTLVVLPLGVPHEVRPVVSGTRFSLTSPLILPVEVVDFMNTRAYTELVRLPGPPPKAADRADLRKLEARLSEAKYLMNKMCRAVTRLSRELEIARRGYESTPTLRLVESDRPVPPFAVLLRGFYRGCNEPGALRSVDDALTYNGLLRLYPGSSIRLVNLACNVEAADLETSDPSTIPEWRRLLENTGWEDQRCEKAMEVAARALSSLNVYYGYWTPPGEISGEVGVWNDETTDPYKNLSITAAVVYAAGADNDTSDNESGEDETA